MRIIFGGAICAALSLFSVGVAHAVPIINVGTNNLLPQTANQTLTLFVSGGDAVAGLNFRVQVADGGPEVGGSVLGPKITNVNITTAPTIFNGNNTGPVTIDGFNGVGIHHTTQYDDIHTTTSAGTVSASGTLAVLTIDTTGFNTGSFPLRLQVTVGGATNFAGVTPTITDGTINIPEPTALSAIGMAALVFFSRRRRAA